MMAIIIWHSLEHAPAALVVLIASLVAIRGYGRRWLAALLRVFAMGAIAIALLRPTLLIQATPAHRGAIVVLLDESASCQIPDPQRQGAQLLAIAQALGRVSPDAQSRLPESEPLDLSALDKTISQVVRAREELDYADVAGQDEEPARQRLQIAGKSFDSLVRDYFRRSERSLAPAVAQEIAGLAQVNAEYGNDEWLRDVRSRIRKITTMQSTLRLTAEERLLQADPQVRKTCEEISRSARSEIAREILKTDLLAQLPADVPVYVFGFSDRVREIKSLSTTQPATSSIANGTDIVAALSSVRSKLAGEKIQAIVLMSDGRQTGKSSALETTLQASGVPVISVPLAPPNPPPDVAVARIDVAESAFAGEIVPVDAEIRSSIPVAKINVHMSSGQQQEMQSIKLEAGKPQVVRFQLATAVPGERKIQVWVDSVAGEVSRENNVRSQTVHVLPSKLRVAVLADKSDEEIEYIRNSLAGLAGAEVSSDRKTMAQQDVIILGAASLSAAEQAELRDAIEHKGKSVIFLSSSAELEESPIGGERKWQRWPGQERVMRVVPAMFDESPLRDGERKISRYVDGISMKSDAHALLVERESRAPVLMERPVGRGRSFFIGSDETRLWNNDDWQRLVRYAWQSAVPVRRLVAENSRDELADLSGDDQFLKRISDATGGEVISVAQVGKLAAHVEAIGEAREKTAEVSLWDSGWLLGIMLAALTAEWAIRKHVGLA